jgi:hypothetical protein
MRHLLLLALVSTPSFAGTWSGTLVDANCYQAARSNVNPTDTSFADRDMEGDVSYCHPTLKTKSFALVESDWTVLPLDAAGNAKAAALVRANPKSQPRVVVTGEREKKVLRVATLARK